MRRKTWGAAILVLIMILVSSSVVGEAIEPIRNQEAYRYSPIKTSLLLRQAATNVAFSQSEGIFYLVGERDYGADGNHASMVVCVDTTGQVLWEQQLPCGQNATTCAFQFAVALPENTIATLHYEYFYVGNEIETIACDLVIINHNGVVTRKPIDISTSGLYAAHNGLLLTAYNGIELSVIKLDTSLDEQWRTIIPDKEISIQGIEMTDEGYLLYGGMGESQYPANAGGSYIAKIDMTGNPLWTDIVSYAPRRYYDVHVVPDEEYIAVGCELGEDVTLGTAASFDSHGSLAAANNYNAYEYGLYQQVTSVNEKTYVVGYSYSLPIELCVYELTPKLTISKYWKSRIGFGEGFSLANPALFNYENNLIIIDSYRGDEQETAPIYFLVIDLDSLQ